MTILGEDRQEVNGARPRPIVLARNFRWGRWLTGGLATAVLAWVVVLFARGQIQWQYVDNFLLDSRIIRGLWYTIAYSVLAMGMGIIGGVLLAVMKLSSNPVLRTISSLYIWVFRGTPILVQLLLWFNIALVLPTLTIGVPFTDLTWSGETNTFVTPFVAALLGLGLHEAAYMAEIVRAGIISVDEGQTEAAQALGMTPGQKMRHIVLPQAMRLIVPPTGNQFIGMLKTTSLVVVIAGEEMLTAAQNIYARNFLTVEVLLTVSIWYLVLTSVSSVALNFIEDRFNPNRPKTSGTTLRRVLQDLKPFRSTEGIQT